MQFQIKKDHLYADMNHSGTLQRKALFQGLDLQLQLRMF